ncbi:MAG: PhzF family phenazine biosynthesis protein [Oscillospiraceae bacterium]|nr:PhzF family phenazine biosynthesis protein [Oscillospiraceae bacterium]
MFKGNSSGVLILENEFDVVTMQNIAIENNLSEIAFVMKHEDYYSLRWFIPKKEVDLCGHATLASAFVITNFIDTNIDEIRFETKSGTLIVNKKDNLYVLNFPSRKLNKTEITKLVLFA